MSDLFFVANVSNNRLEQRYVSFWRAGDRGYTPHLVSAGRYPREKIMANLDYYNSGANLAVPCSLVEQLAVTPDPQVTDASRGPVVPSNAECWDTVIAFAIAEPRCEPKPAHRRAPSAPSTLAELLIE